MMSGPARVVLAVVQNRAADGTEVLLPELAHSIGMPLQDLHHRLNELSRANMLRLERGEVGDQGVPVRFHLIDGEGMNNAPEH